MPSSQRSSGPADSVHRRRAGHPEKCGKPLTLPPPHRGEARVRDHEHGAHHVCVGRWQRFRRLAPSGARQDVPRARPRRGREPAHARTRAIRRCSGGAGGRRRALQLPLRGGETEGARSTDPARILLPGCGATGQDESLTRAARRALDGRPHRFPRRGRRLSRRRPGLPQLPAPSTRAAAAAAHRPPTQDLCAHVVLAGIEGRVRSTRSPDADDPDPEDGDAPRRGRCESRARSAGAGGRRLSWKNSSARRSSGSPACD